MNGKEYLEERGYKMYRPGLLHELALALFAKRFGDDQICVYSFPPMIENHRISYEVVGYIEVGDLAMSVKLYPIFDSDIEERLPQAEAVLIELFDKYKS